MSLTRYLVAFYRKNVQVSFSVASFMCPRQPSEELKTSAACNFFLFFFPSWNVVDEETFVES